MTGLEAFFLALNGAGLAWLVFLFGWSRWTKGKPKTTPEAAVRGLFYLARWLRALAEGLDSGIIAYRDMTRELCPPRAEVDRTLRAMKFERRKAVVEREESADDAPR